MKKIGLLFLVLGFSFTSMFCTQLVITVSGSTTHHVYLGQSIQEVINSSKSGDTIFVHAGTYYEHLTINKSISLIGENRNTAIIDGSRNGTVISVIADCVNIRELTIQNGYHIPHVTYGIKVGEQKNGYNKVTVSGNIISNNDIGIFLKYSNNAIVTNNIVSNNFQGIAIVQSNDNHIAGNNLSNNGEGVSIGADADNNMICDNEISNGDFAIHVGWSMHNGIIGNTISLNTYAGIRFDASNNNTIIGNTITLSSRNGIVLYGSTGNTLIANELIQNKWDGIAVYYSNANVIYHNNFWNNTKQAGSYSGSTNTWDNGYSSGGNYWSDYTGVDLYSGPYQNETGSDGIGDTPYYFDRYPLMEPYILSKEMLVLYYELLRNYSELHGNYDFLQASHDILQTDYYFMNVMYDSLNSSYNELTSKQEATISELNFIKNLMYVFIITTIVFIATTAYLAIRKPKVTSELETAWHSFFTSLIFLPNSISS